MAILKPIQKTEMKSISAKIPKHLKEDINDYCKFSNINGLQDFIIQASEYILEKDKDWAKHRKERNAKTENP